MLNGGPHEAFNSLLKCSAESFLGMCCEVLAFHFSLKEVIFPPNPEFIGCAATSIFLVDPGKVVILQIIQCFNCNGEISALSSFLCSKWKLEVFGFILRKNREPLKFFELGTEKTRSVLLFYRNKKYSDSMMQNGLKKIGIQRQIRRLMQSSGQKTSKI